MSSESNQEKADSLTATEHTVNNNDMDLEKNNISKSDKSENIEQLKAEEGQQQSPIVPPPYSAFSEKRKTAILLIITMTGFLGPMSGNIYIPLLPKFQVVFDTNSTAINATVSVFMFIMALSPLIWASFADIGGRKTLYIVSLVFFILADILLAALPPNIAALFVLRIVQAFGASSVLSVGAGTVTDITEPKNRGKAISHFMMGPQLGPVVGPILSVIAKANDNSWRWIFGLLAILGGLIYILILFCLPETLRYLVGNGSALNLQTWYVIPKLRQKKLVEGFPRPPKPSVMNFIRLLKYIPVALSCINAALLFAGFYAVSIQFSKILQNEYNYNDLQSSFSYVCPGGALIIGSLTAGRLSDRLKKIDSIPEHRIPLQLVGFIICIAGLLMFGWCADRHVHVATLFVGTFLNAFGMTWVFVITTTYLTECFKAQAATNVALVNMFRNAAAGVSSLIIHVLIERMTVGWAFTGLALCLLIPILNVFIIMKKGGEWREQLQIRQAKK